VYIFEYIKTALSLYFLTDFNNSHSNGDDFFYELRPVFWIRDILVRIRMCGSGSLTGPNSYPAPALFVSDLQDGNKK
jgi:hypothetical protein